MVLILLFSVVIYVYCAMKGKSNPEAQNWELKFIRSYWKCNSIVLSIILLISIPPAIVGGVSNLISLLYDKDVSYLFAFVSIVIYFLTLIKSKRNATKIFKPGTKLGEQYSGNYRIWKQIAGVQFLLLSISLFILINNNQLLDSF